jgi:hypothetical protein
MTDILTILKNKYKSGIGRSDIKQILHHELDDKTVRILKQNDGHSYGKTGTDFIISPLFHISTFDQNRDGSFERIRIHGAKTINGISTEARGNHIGLECLEFTFLTKESTIDNIKKFTDAIEKLENDLEEEREKLSYFQEFGINKVDLEEYENFKKMKPSEKRKFLKQQKLEI